MSRTDAPPGRLAMSKHEGAGNDFLVVVDPAATMVLGPEAARALCDRHRGVGADGVIVVRPGTAEADLEMLLRNADGSEAEMSGNGIRCLAQAAVDAGMVTPPRFTVATAAGVRTVEYRPAGKEEAMAAVDMGVALLGPEERPPGPGLRARRVDVGNPHLVVLCDQDVSTLDVAAIGSEAAAGVPGGANVELFAPGPRPGELVLRVWERGVGETRACGTGSCAVAAAARSWGMVGDRVLVRNPGGTLEVRLGRGERGRAVLAGPVRRVADVVVDAAGVGVYAADVGLGQDR